MSGNINADNSDGSIENWGLWTNQFSFIRYCNVAEGQPEIDGFEPTDMHTKVYAPEMVQQVPYVM